MTKSLRLLDPEDAHSVTIYGLRLAQAADLVLANKLEIAPLQTQINYQGGVLKLPNCIGLAAGFDKNAHVPKAMLGFGFGYVECGTVTPLAQDGNPRPRIFRLKDDAAIINRLGFNNLGLEAFCARLNHLKDHRFKGIIGANIGANKDSNDRINDYVIGLKTLWGLSSYFTINISSPNTPGLRALQSSQHIDELLSKISETRHELRRVTGENYPILLKIAPDLDEGEITDVVQSTIGYGLDGMIVSNTTITRPFGLMSANASEAGGLSGEPLFEASTLALAHAYKVSKGKLFLIGAGGVSTGAQAYAKIRAGANAVQLYSALVYHGPDLVGKIARDLKELLAQDGFESVNDAVGADALDRYESITPI